MLISFSNPSIQEFCWLDKSGSDFVTDEANEQHDLQNSTPKRGRKRVRKPETHKKVIRKYKRERGEEYISVSGNKVPKKQCSLDPCDCTLQCHTLISNKRKQKIFESFYNMSWSLKNAFISGQVEVQDVKRRYNKNEVSRRSKTRVYLSA